MSELLFKFYISENPHYSGFLSFNDFQKAFPNDNILKYEELLRWFNNSKNKTKIEEILVESKVNVSENLKKGVNEFRKFKQKQNSKVPSLECFQSIGMFDHHD